MTSNLFLSAQAYNDYLYEAVERCSLSIDKPFVRQILANWFLNYHLTRLFSTLGEVLQAIGDLPYYLYLDSPQSVELAHYVQRLCPVTHQPNFMAYVVEPSLLQATDTLGAPVVSRGDALNPSAFVLTLSGSHRFEDHPRCVNNDYASTFVDLTPYLELAEHLKAERVVLYINLNNRQQFAAIAGQFKRDNAPFKTICLTNAPSNGNEADFDYIITEPALYLWPAILQLLSAEIVHTNIQSGMDGLPLAPFLDPRRTVIDFYDIIGFLPSYFFEFAGANETLIKNTEAAFIQGFRYFIHRCSEWTTQALQDKYGVDATIRGVTEYLQPPLFESPVRDDSHIRLVFGGGLPHSIRHEMWPAFAEAAKAYSTGDLKLDLYPTPYLHNAIDAMANFIVENKLHNVSLRSPLDEKAFIETLPQYDFGLIFFRARTLCQQEYHYILSHKFIAYLRAGLPVVVDAHHTFMADLIRKYDIGVVIRDEDYPHIESILKQQDIRQLKENVRKFRHHFDIRLACKKVAEVYDQVRAQRHPLAAPAVVPLLKALPMAPLPDTRRFNIVAILDVADPSITWKSALKTYVTSFTSESDVALHLLVMASSAKEIERVGERIQEVLQSLGIAEDACPDIVLHALPGDLSQWPSLIKSSQAYLSLEGEPSLYRTVAQAVGVDVVYAADLDTLIAPDPSLNGAEPAVSVIVPTYNRPETLVVSLRSILNQTFQDFEIIVVNDAGHDVESLISGLEHGGRISYVKHGKNRDRAAARNTGLRLARGKYVTYLDDDDLYYPEHLETLVRALESSNYKVAYTDAHRATQILEHGRYVITRRDVPYSVDFDFDRLLVGNFIPVLCFMHERECLDDVGLFDETLTTHEDWDLLIRLTHKYHPRHIAKVTCEFSWRDDGSSTTSSKPLDFWRTQEIVYEKTWPLVVDKPHVVAQRKHTMEWIQARRREVGALPTDMAPQVAEPETSIDIAYLPDRSDFNLIVAVETDDHLKSLVFSYLKAFHPKDGIAMHVLSGSKLPEYQALVLDVVTELGLSPESIPDISLVDQPTEHGAFEPFLRAGDLILGSPAVVERARVLALPAITEINATLLRLALEILPTLEWQSADFPLDTERSERWLVTGDWAPALDAFLRSVQPTEDTALILKVAPGQAQATFEAIEGWISNHGHDPAQLPEILIVDPEYKQLPALFRQATRWVECDDLPGDLIARALGLPRIALAPSPSDF